MDVKINLGCGGEVLTGYDNFDINNASNDPRIMYINLEKPLPFTANCVDEIRIHGTLEHIKRWIPLMREMYRVLKPGGILDIRVPNYACRDAWADPTHINFFTSETWGYFERGNNHGNESGYYDGLGCNFRTISVKRASRKFNLLRRLGVPAQAIEFLSGDLLVKLRAIK